MSKPYKIVRTFEYSSEAQILKGRLLAEGVDAFLLDQHTIDTDPLMSVAIGGVKLAVLEQDYEKAIAILDEIPKYSLDDEGEAISCPNCGSTNVDYFTTINSARALVSFIVGCIFSVFPFYTKYAYRCSNCKKQFNLDE